MLVQYQISNATPDDVPFVVGLYAAVAAKHGLEDRFIESLVANTLANFSDVERPFPFAVASRMEADKIFIDFNPSKGNQAKFEIVTAELIAALENHFAPRITQATAETYCKSQNTLPMTEELRAHLQKRMRQL